MRNSIVSVWLVAATTLVSGQTFTKCNPLTTTCSPDPALGKTVSIDFTSGAASDQFSGSASSYDSNGAGFSVAKPGDSPTITSNWYMMFGHVEVVLKTAPGVGIVTSMVLQSDDLDEIDFEWLGGDNAQVQTNYFGHGLTTSYNRGAFHANSGNHDGYHKYTIDWTAEEIVWQIDDKTVRALTPQDSLAASYPYPQTPMQLKLGIWAGGDPSNPQGTIAWAGGQTNYGAGPFTMYVKSVLAQDYSTGSSYTYSDTSGTWQSIRSSGGAISGSGSPGAAAAAASAPTVTEASSGAPSPFAGTHKDSTTFVQPSVWPWVPSSTLATAAAATSQPSIGGWTPGASGTVRQSAAPSTAPPSSPTYSPPPALSTVSASPNPNGAGAAGAGSGGSEAITTFNEQGFLTTIIVPAGWATAVKSYDEHGFLITPTPAPTPAAGSDGTNGATFLQQGKAKDSSSGESSSSTTNTPNAAALVTVGSIGGAMSAFLWIIGFLL